MEKNDFYAGKNLQKSTFLSHAGHELRSPLTSILGFTDLVLNDQTNKISNEQREQLTIVYESARDLLNLINNVVDISKIEAGEIELVPKTFLLDDVINEVLSKLEGGLAEKGLHCRVDVLPGTRLFQDKYRFTQVLANLVSNSIKFTDTGIIELTGNKIGTCIQVSVKDSGIGIKEEDIPRLFEPFAQINSKSECKPRGTNLGLCLCKKIVNLMQGRIWAESEFGKGSVFTFNIPVEYNEVDK